MNKQIQKYGEMITEYAKNNYRLCFREANGILNHPFLVPGSAYAFDLWDWDSWLTDLALGKIADKKDIIDCEKGCILNFLEHVDEEGRMPIYIQPAGSSLGMNQVKETNIHKPCLAQHALFIAENYDEYDWLGEKFDIFTKFLGWYDKNCYHKDSGLYVWYDDFAIGVDNDPCTFYRPGKSSASIYLNSMMYLEFKAVAKLAEKLGKTEISNEFSKKAENLKLAIQENCWDERDGFFYNCDVNLLPVDKNSWLHSGCPRHWNTLIQRIEVWSGFMAMWAGIATEAQAERMVKEHYLNPKTFFAPYGIRTLSKMEKMYAIIKSGNPSCWLGPIWGISNFITFDALRKYGYKAEATDLAEKTITMFGRDIENCGEMHEYYDPESGEGVNNPGFQNWNFLSVNMFEWLKEQ